MEVLVALALLALAAGIVGAGLRALQGRDARQASAAVIAQAAEARLRAMVESVPVAIELDQPDGSERLAPCEAPGAPPTLGFLPDGGGRGGDLCLTAGGAETRLRLDPITGRLREVSP